jgi:hypothetical protein
MMPHLCQLEVVHAVKVDAVQQLLLVLLALLLVVKPLHSAEQSSMTLCFVQFGTTCMHTAMCSEN